jgi:hypothetical protein
LLGAKEPSAADAVPNIGIVGAGAAGLFTAMILKWLKAHAVDADSKPFNYTCDIVEASSVAGGRLNTHSFSGTQQDLYFDVGAMRYPQNDVMTRTFDLFSTVGMTQATSLAQAQLGQLVPYYMQNVDATSQEQLEYFCYNDVVQCGSIDKIMPLNSNDPFNMNVAAMGIDPSVLGQNPNTVLNGVIQEFRTQLESNTSTAWDWMMSYDKCSARGFLSGNYIPPAVTPVPGSPKYNFETVEWLENFNGGTGWYDQALSEVVLESIDFDEDPKDDKPWPWFCIFGGSVQLANNMITWLDNSANIKLGKRVSRISWDNGQAQVTVNTTASDTWTYDAVFSSTTLSTLKLMDLSDLQGLPYGTKQAIRCLAYGPSAKVGLVFSDPWWRTLTVNPILSGGQGHSDLNIRTCVYPSYNIGDIAKNDKEFVLLCSYTWQADAERIGSWIGQDGDEPDLINLILQDLARMHASQTQSAEQLLPIITKSYTKKYYAHDWTHDPNTAGAFAFFRPGQFANLWPQLNRANASPNFYIIGEHASAHHAWVVGALESAVAGVYQWLSNNSTLPGVSGPNGALTLLETPQTGNPFVGLPTYMETSVLEWNKHLNMMEALLVETLHNMKAAKK